MYPNTSFDVIAECRHGYIGVCKGCREYNFSYNNIAITFQEDDMLRFCEWLVDSRLNPDNRFSSINGRDIVCPSPLNNMFLVFRDDELEDISQMLTETRLVLEARRLAAFGTY